LKIWDLPTGQSQELGRPADRPLTALAVQSGGKLLAVGQGGGEPAVALWDTESLESVARIELGGAGPVVAAFSPSGQRLAAAAEGAPVLVYQQDDWRKPSLKIEGEGSDATALTFSTDESALIVAYSNGRVRFFDVASGQPQPRWIELKIIPLALCHCEEGRVLAIGTDTGEIHLWEVAAGRMRHVIKGNSGRIASLAVLADGVRLVTAGRDRDLKLWHTVSGEPITTFSGHIRQVYAVAVSPDGQTIASGGFEGDVRLWRAQAGR
jgi:WD40 repeat protein